VALHELHQKSLKIDLQPGDPRQRNAEQRQTQSLFAEGALVAATQRKDKNGLQSDSLRRRAFAARCISV